MNIPIHAKIVEERSSDFNEAAKTYTTPLYVYSEEIIRRNCQEFKKMSSPFGLRVRYAMKANSTRALLKIIDEEGIEIDASSFNEAKRAVLAGISPSKIMYTSQEVLTSSIERKEIEDMVLKGMKMNICSKRQLMVNLPFLQKKQKELKKPIPISLRIHPGEGSGESFSRDTGSEYSCFGIHLSDLSSVLKICKDHFVSVDQIHCHIGSGGSPSKWKKNVDKELDIISSHPFLSSGVQIISFGGGFRVQRSPADPPPANLSSIASYAAKAIEKQAKKKEGRKLVMEVEPGTAIVANAGFVVTTIVDVKETKCYEFVVLDGGMEINSRPILYGAHHPFYILDGKDGKMRSSEFRISAEKKKEEGVRESSEQKKYVVVGKCCESGDCQTVRSTPDEHGSKIGVRAVQCAVRLGDRLIIGGAGAYCASMTPFNYNSHTQVAEVLLKTRKGVRLIRKRQTLHQMLQNEM